MHPRDSGGAGDGLWLTPAQREAILAHVAAEAPNEACGLLSGHGGRVEQVHPGRNVEASPVSYLMDPTEQVRILLEIEAAGRELSAIYHSHPAGPPIPSATDVAQAYYPEAVYVIAAPAASGWELRGFRVADGRVHEVPVSTGEPDSTGVGA